jgi:formylglycine-generating enzyme required for sulfatase activity
MKSQTTSLATLAVLLATAAAFAADDIGKLKQLEAADWTVPGLDLKLKRIPAGKFVMGSPADEMCRRDDESPHEVTLGKPFYVGVCEVTQREFYKLMMPPDYNYDAWQYKRGPIADGAAFHFRYPTGKGLIFRESAVGGKLTDLNPMECVTWARAMEFCAKLTDIEKQAGRLPAGYVYRLPTEAEWEYACRAGTKGPYHIEADYTKIDSIRAFAWVAGPDSVFGTRSVGTRKPNAWGLYDMHGNVYEWCLDWYGPYPKGPVADPTGSATGKERVVRGGCFAAIEKKESTSDQEALAQCIHPFMRSASRYRVNPELSYLGIVGFRVVLAPEITR